MIKKYKPTSPGSRSRKTLVKNVAKGRSEKSLTTPLKGAVGRTHGRITSRFRLRGAKRHYRIVDFKREKYGIEAKVAKIEHDPNRGPNIALLNYADGEKRYILAPEGLVEGMTVISGKDVEATVGNTLPLENIPLGAVIHNIELNPGQGGKIVRGAGNSAQILAKEGRYVNIKLPSGEAKRVLGICFATVGVLSNADLRNTENPTDHPHGGSYKDNGIGMPAPKSPWGWQTRGKLTRSRNRTNRTVVKSRRGRVSFKK